jgi:predicted enzyme related to lactoylglutathione lyase
MTLAAAELVAFVPSSDLGRSQRFYESVLGLTVVEMTPYACVVRSGVTTLRVTATESVRPQPFTVLGWTVDDIRVELRPRPVAHRWPGSTTPTSTFCP